MTKSDLELFKEALTEGISRHFQNEIDSFEGEVVISERHKRAMRTIFDGAKVRPFVWPSARAKIAAAALAASILLASCAVAYRDEIRNFVEKVYEDYISVSFENSDEAPKWIEEYYEPTYIPEGYVLNEHIKTNLQNIYCFENLEGYIICFKQQVLNGAVSFDSEHSEYDFIYISEMKVYYLVKENYYCYLWNDGKYALTIESTQQLSFEELENIINQTKNK